jgi:hypothetical protein
MPAWALGANEKPEVNKQPVAQAAKNAEYEIAWPVGERGIAQKIESAQQAGNAIAHGGQIKRRKQPLAAKARDDVEPGPAGHDQQAGDQAFCGVRQVLRLVELQGRVHGVSVGCLADGSRAREGVPAQIQGSVFLMATDSPGG